MQSEQFIESDQQALEKDLLESICLAESQSTFDFFKEPKFVSFPNFDEEREVEEEPIINKSPKSDGKFQIVLQQVQNFIESSNICKKPKSSPPSLQQAVRNSAEMDIELAQARVEVEYKNQTKNIPKNFGKAIIKYIKKNRRIIEPYLRSENIEYEALYEKLKQQRNFVTTIAELRSLWTQWPEKRVMRVISHKFLQKNSWHTFTVQKLYAEWPIFDIVKNFQRL